MQEEHGPSLKRSLEWKKLVGLPSLVNKQPERAEVRETCPCPKASLSRKDSRSKASMLTLLKGKCSHHFASKSSTIARF